MKKNFMLGMFATFAVAAFAFSGLTPKPTSIDELRAKAWGSCHDAANQTCPQFGGPGNNPLYYNHEYTP